jgi:hypothetical protein
VKLALCLAAFAAVLGCIPAAKSQYNCHEDLLGTLRCNGSVNGNSIRLESRTDLLDNQQIRGTINGEPFRQTCHTDLLGNYRCR